MINLIKRHASGPVAASFIAVATALNPAFTNLAAQDVTTYNDPTPNLSALLEAGEIATFTCSGVFIAGRTLEQLKTLELTNADGSPYKVAGVVPEILIDDKQRTVAVSYSEFLPPMRAAFRDGLGCSVLPVGSGPNAGENLPKLSKKRPGYDKANTDWPKKGLLQPAKTPKPYQARLDSAIERTFRGEGHGPGARTIATLIVHKGEVVAERYRDGFGPHTQYRTWSTAKSLASAVIGAAIQDGVLPGVETTAPIPEWRDTNDPRADITLENLLHMASGLRSVVPDDGSNTPAAYWAGIDSAADAVSQPLIHKPGAHWHYANYDTLLLMRSLKAALGDDQKYRDYPYRRLFDRIGMHDTFAETDPYGNYVMSSQVYTNARDLARFATLFLNDGVWRGQRILPEGWADYSCTSTDAEPKPSWGGVEYGAQWWIYPVKFDADAGVENLKVCSTNGARGQYAAFSPEHDLVMVRRGVDAWEMQGFDEVQFFKDVIAAVSAPLE
ncbi:MAG: serine hydrolase [Pseudomonadota bacterium]